MTPDSDRERLTTPLRAPHKGATHHLQRILGLLGAASRGGHLVQLQEWAWWDPQPAIAVAAAGFIPL